jgi:hypothetical protein
MLILKKYNHQDDYALYTSAKDDSQFRRSICNSSISGATFLLHIVVKKLPQSTYDLIPMQGIYKKFI